MQFISALGFNQPFFYTLLVIALVLGAILVFASAFPAASVAGTADDSDYDESETPTLVVATGGTAASAVHQPSKKQVQTTKPPKKSLKGWE
jgi:hypothetical protein